MMVGIKEGTVRDTRKLQQSTGSRTPIGLMYLVAILMLAGCLVFTMPSFAAAEGVRLSDGFMPDYRLPAGLAFNETGRPLLYEKNRDVPLEIPAVARLGLLLVSAEQIQRDELIEISARAAALETGRDTEAARLFQPEHRLPYAYLIRHMLFNYSDGAALAIAEHMAGDEATCRETVQKRLREIGMYETELRTLLIVTAERDHPAPAYFSDTNLNWCDGVFADIASPTPDPEREGCTLIPNADGGGFETARTTLNDLSLLLQTIYGNAQARTYLSEMEALVQISELGGSRIVPLRANTARLFNLSEGKINAAFHCPSGRYSLTASFGKTDEDIQVMTLLITPRPSTLIDETLKLYDGIDAYYDRTVLAQQGERYADVTEVTESGEIFYPVYLETVYVVQPADRFFVKPDVDYIGDAPYELPIQRDVMTGRVIFELLDGTKIPVRLGPDRDILSTNTLFAKGITLLHHHPNLAVAIFAVSILLCVLLLVICIREGLRLFYWYRVGRLERAGHAHRDAHADGEGLTSD